MQEPTIRSDEHLAQMITGVARSVRADVLLCGTETGALFRRVCALCDDVRLLAATPNSDTRDQLVRDGFGVVLLSLRLAQKYTQARHAIAAAFTEGRLSAGDLVVCAIGHDLCRGGSDLVLVTDIEPGAGALSLTDIVKLTDGIRPDTLQKALDVACTIARVTRAGRRLGSLFVLGDSVRVLEGSKQLILNPFEGHADADRTLRNRDIGDMLVELSKLDGAFVVRGDGFIQTAGTFLAASGVDVSVPAGLGARHLTAAAVTARTSATAVVVSSTDGYVRVFSHGEMVLQMDPELSMAPIATKHGV